MKKLCFLVKLSSIIFLTSLSLCSIAQDRRINGVVMDSKTNTALEGASIAVETKTGNAPSASTALSKADGKFQISIPTGKARLIVTFIGFEKTFVNVGENQTNVLIKLNETASKAMEDVVVIGSQRQTKRTTTTAVSSISGKDIENLPAPSVDQLLQGRVAGLNVQVTSGEPGVTPTVVVRGNSRVSTNIGDPDVAQARALSGPLYVIDGIPINPEDISNNIDATGTNYLAGINVNDIESVDVQKDAAATAAWGSRGANGVIYIRTKKGRATKPEFRVNVYGGVTLQPQLLGTVTGAAERQQKLDIINTYGTAAQKADLPQFLTDRFNPYFNNATDWQNLFYQNGAVKNADLTMSGGSDNASYRVSMNYYDEQGIIKSFGYQRYSVRGNFDFKISPKLTSQFIIAMSKGDRQRGKKYNNNSDENIPVSGAAQPTSFIRLTQFDSLNFSGLYSKLRNKNINDVYTASFTLNYSILPALKYMFQGSANVSTSNRDYFQPSNIDQISALNGGVAQPSKAQSDKGSYATYFVANTLNYAKKITTAKHVHNFSLLGTQQFNAEVSNSNSVGGINIPSNDIQVVSGVPQGDLTGKSSYAASGLLSFAGQGQYDFDGKYLLYASYRGDASSRFGDKTKWGYFPAVGAGWVVSDEKFMDGLKDYVGFLKLRGSYGVSGTQASDFYAPFNSYTIPGTYGGSAAIQPSYDNGLTKSNLTWAKTMQKNIGLETQLFNNRVSLVVDAYEKISKDDFYNFALPFYTGFETVKFKKPT